MSDLREELHRLIDELPDATLQQAKAALAYCANPHEHVMAIEKAKERARHNLERHLRRYAERTGQGAAFAGAGGGHTFIDGSHHSSMPAFIDGEVATYHLYMHQGVIFEVIEVIAMSQDGKRLIRREQISGADGKEQVFAAELPVLPTDSASPGAV